MTCATHQRALIIITAGRVISQDNLAVLDRRERAHPLGPAVPVRQFGTALLLYSATLVAFFFFFFSKPAHDARQILNWRSSG